MHKLAQIPTRCLQDKMRMIRHQGVQIQSNIKPLHTLRQFHQEFLTILICLEDCLTIITTNRHVVNCTFID